MTDLRKHTGSLIRAIAAEASEERISEIVLRNNLDCEICRWASMSEMIRDMQRGYVILAAGDTIKVEG